MWFGPKKSRKGFEGAWKSKKKNYTTLDVSSPSSIPYHWNYDGILVLNGKYTYPVKCDPTH